MKQMKQETRDEMIIQWDAPILMSDGLTLRADVFRPMAEGKFPVIITYGPYAKGLHFQEGYKSHWARLTKSVPALLTRTSNKYQNWELVDPENWVRDNYIIIRVDSRGAGRSPGMMDCWSAQETQDFHECIEWAGTQSWSNGKVGLNGISYYAMNQWTVAATKPKHLSAICMWEGSSDYYRELARHGGILCDFLDTWYKRQVLGVQHGVGDRGSKSIVTNEPIAGPLNLNDEELKNNRLEIDTEVLNREFIDDYYLARMPDFSQIDVPLLSTANWGGQGLHPRGNYEGYLRASSKQKWLEVHGDTHFTHFYSEYGEPLQKKFFAHFLKGENTGWENQPAVSLNIRWPGEKFVLRAENEWPIARTQWTKFYLHPENLGLSPDMPISEKTLGYQTMADGLRFMTPPMSKDLEITGPLAAKIWVSSKTNDADLFLVLGVYDPDGKEVVFVGSNDPRTPVGLGWLRASHRKLDPKKSTPYRPWHTHDEKLPLTPNKAEELDVEIWPTSIVVPQGYRLALTIRGKDYEFDGTAAPIPNAPFPMKGVGPFTHTNPIDRPPQIFNTTNYLHFSEGSMPYVLLPIIPSTRS